MTVTNRRSVSISRSREPMLAQGRIEKVFVQADVACTERAVFATADAGREPSDGGFAMARGILTGSLAERELASYAQNGALTVDLGREVDALLAKMRLGTSPGSRVAELRSSAIEWVRQWQQGFPPEDGDLDWSDVAYVLDPQHDLFVRRPDRFSIRARPDIVVGVGAELIAVEFSTAKNPASISSARVALNHHALIRERLRRPEWNGFQAVATRVEMLALGYGFTVRLAADEAERWRQKIGEVAEDLVEGRHAKNIGPHCGACWYQQECWLGGEEIRGSVF